MIANALLFTIAILLGYGFWLLDQLKFMAAYKRVLIHAYSDTLMLSLAVLFVNVFGLALTINRSFLLKDTGRKLSHLDKQFHIRSGIFQFRQRKRSCAHMSRDPHFSMPTLRYSRDHVPPRSVPAPQSHSTESRESQEDSVVDSERDIAASDSQDSDRPRPEVDRFRARLLPQGSPLHAARIRAPHVRRNWQVPSRRSRGPSQIRLRRRSCALRARVGHLKRSLW